MSLESPVVTLRWLLGESPLLARLFFASLELAGLAVLVLLWIRLARIRSPRVVSLLWLVVLVKPLVSLAVGSPLPILLLEPGEAQIGLTAERPPSVAYVPPDAPRFGWAASPGDPLGDWALSEAPGTPASAPLAPVAPSDPLPSEGSPEGSLPRAITIAWLIGVAMFLGRYVWAQIRLWQIVRAAERPPAWVLARYRAIASEWRLRRIPRLLVTDVLDSPAITGLLRPVVLVPSWLAGSADDRKLAWSLRHELTHWKWLDPVAVLVRDAVAVLFYFHPVAWWAAKRQAEAMELACDRAMLRSESDAANYAEQLFAVLKNIRRRRRWAVAGGLFATRTQVGNRIAALLDGHAVSRRQLTVLSVVGVSLLAAGAMAVGGAVRSGESEEAQDEPAAGYRVLRFPKTRTVGMIRARDPRPLGSDWKDGWEEVGPAKGSVRVPRGKDVWLQVTEQPASDMRWLSALAPDDVEVITFDDTPPDASVAQLARLSGLKWLVFYDRLPRGAGFDYLSRLKSLEGLLVAGSAITDDELGVLANRLTGLESCRRLELGSTELTDAGLAHLESLQSLEGFFGGSNKITGSGFSHLARLPALKEVGFGSEEMGDAAPAHLAECASLKRLTLNCPKITDAGIAGLAKSKSLEALKLKYVPMTDAGLAHLSQVKTLRELELKATQVTDAGLAHLARLTSLEVLRLPRGIGESGQVQLTDAGLAHLRGLKGLKHLWLERPQYTGAGVQFLADLKLPWCPMIVVRLDTPATRKGARHGPSGRRPWLGFADTTGHRLSVRGAFAQPSRNCSCT
jgi:beta-lactamase regulating signal transducer with metallopeptidase domain